MIVAKVQKIRENISEKWEFPHVFVVLTVSLCLAGLLTFIIPSGQYLREEVMTPHGSQTLVIPGTYHSIPKEISLTSFLSVEHHTTLSTSSTLMTLLSAIPKGLVDSAEVIFCVLMVGGMFGVLKNVGVINDAIDLLVYRFRHSKYFLSGIMVTVLAFGGSTYGLGEELVPLVPVFVSLSQRLGYDRLYAVTLVFLAAAVGCGAGMTDPFNVLIAQKISQLPLYSGLGLRFAFFICCLSITLAYIFRYGKKVEKNVEEQAEYVRPESANQTLLIVSLCGVIYLGVIYGVVSWGWDLSEMAGGFLLMIVITALIKRISLNQVAHSFNAGMEEMVLPVVVIGIARGIVIVMQDAQILDTIIHYTSGKLEHLSHFAAAEGMLIFQTCLNVLIPSGSGQASVTMPVMAPLSDLLGITRQTAVFAFQCGNGFANMIVPTYGMLLAMLSLAGVSYVRWLRFIFPLFFILMVLASLFLGIAVWIEYT